MLEITKKDDSQLAKAIDRKTRFEVLKELYAIEAISKKQYSEKLNMLLY